MHRRSIHHLATVGALALTVVAVTAACSPDTVSPLPIQTPSQTLAATPSASSPPATPPPASQPPKPAKTPSPQPTASNSSCMGAIRYDLDLQNTELALLKSMCFATGAVLRVQGIGPGELSAEPADLVSQQYEAGVVDIRFVRPGTVTVTIPQPEQTYTITVVVR